MNMLLGNEHIKKILQSSKNLRSFIIEGPHGSGKHTLLDEMILSSICEDGTSCGKCGPCKRFLSKNSLDVIRLEAPIPVAELREVLLGVSEYPRTEKYKFYVIENADALSDTCQNVLLKNIEEPPDFAYFILLCGSKESLLNTVVSRCTVLPLKPLTDEQVKAFLQQRHGEKEQSLCERAILGSRGYLGRAEEIYLGKKSKADERCEEFFGALAEGDTVRMLKALAVDKKREEFNELVDTVLNNIKAVVVSDFGTSVSGLSENEKRVAALGAKRVNAIYSAFLQVRSVLDRNVNISLWSVYIIKECMKKI